MTWPQSWPVAWAEGLELRDAWLHLRKGTEKDEQAFVSWLLINCNELFAESRPACFRCRFEPGFTYETRPRPDGVYYQHRIECPDCIGHPGWAVCDPDDPERLLA